MAANIQVTIPGLHRVTTAANGDYLVVANSTNTAAITVNSFANVIGALLFTNAAIDVANVDSLTTNVVVITKATTPTTNTDTVIQGNIWSDGNYIYVADATNHIRRVALSDFD